jgi:hypothetical protein
MKLKTAFTMALLTGSLWVAAQQYQIDREAQSAMSRLGFIVGQWEGSGWIMGMERTKHTFSQTENVQFRLDSTVILVEGLGKTGEMVTHNALAVISFNKEGSGYHFNSYLSSGVGGTFTGELKEDAFYWYPNENIRYTIRINDEGQWYEKGEMNRGGEWFQFMEMTLDKTD